MLCLLKIARSSPSIPPSMKSWVTLSFRSCECSVGRSSSLASSGGEWMSLCFARSRLPESCQFVIEAKRFGAGVEGAFDQARAYVEKLGVLRDVVVTDGVRYRLYSASEDFAPAAYANLARLKPSALKLMTTMKRP